LDYGLGKAIIFDLAGGKTHNIYYVYFSKEATAKYSMHNLEKAIAIFPFYFKALNLLMRIKYGIQIQ